MPDSLASQFSQPVSSGFSEETLFFSTILYMWWRAVEEDALGHLVASTRMCTHGHSYQTPMSVHTHEHIQRTHSLSSKLYILYWLSGHNTLFAVLH